MLPDKAAPYKQIILSAAKRYGILPELIAAHIQQESNWDPRAYRYEAAINDASYGLMQLLSRTASEVAKRTISGEMLYDPTLNIELGSALIAKNLSRWPNIKDAVAAYNAGKPRKNAIGLYVNSYGIPNVQYYVEKVYNNLQEYLGKGKEYVTPINVGVIGLILATAGIAYVILQHRRSK